MPSVTIQGLFNNKGVDKKLCCLLDWNGWERWCQVDKYVVGDQGVYAQAAEAHGRSGQTSPQGTKSKPQPGQIQLRASPP